MALLRAFYTPQSHRFSYLLEEGAGVRSLSNKKDEPVQPQHFEPHPVRVTPRSSHTF